MAQAHRKELAAKLREITGWRNLNFDQHGVLRLGEIEPVGGSQTARALLNAALGGRNLIVLEDASNRQDVVFCRVVEGRWRNVAAERPPVYLVMIDFADFSYLTGDEAALAAFNVGWGVLHEIEHVVHDSVDAEKEGETGACEATINLMRRECGLAERTNYFFTFIPGTRESAFLTRLVRLAFDLQVPETNKKRRYWLVWDASLVGGLKQQTQIASAR